MSNVRPDKLPDIPGQQSVRFCSISKESNREWQIYVFSLRKNAENSVSGYFETNF